VFRNLRLHYRAAKRIGAFGRATQQGMTAEQARAASDAVYPSTAEDLAFEASLREGTADPLPWGSMLGLLVAVAALLYILRTPATALEIAGYALSQLGYVLAAAGIFKGTFLALGLRKRSHVFALAAVCLVVGVALVNVRT